MTVSLYLVLLFLFEFLYIVQMKGSVVSILFSNYIDIMNGCFITIAGHIMIYNEIIRLVKIISLRLGTFGNIDLRY